MPHKYFVNLKRLQPNQLYVDLILNAHVLLCSTAYLELIYAQHV